MIHFSVNSGTFGYNNAAQMSYATQSHATSLITRMCVAQGAIFLSTDGWYLYGSTITLCNAQFQQCAHTNICCLHHVSPWPSALLPTALCSRTST